MCCLLAGNEAEEVGPSTPTGADSYGGGFLAAEEERPRRFAGIRDRAKNLVKQPSAVPMDDRLAAAYRVPSFMVRLKACTHLQAFL